MYCREFVTLKDSLGAGEDSLVSNNEMLRSGQHAMINRILIRRADFLIALWYLRLPIDLAPLSSYNTFMTYPRRPRAGFFRPDHDPPRPPDVRRLLSL